MPKYALKRLPRLPQQREKDLSDIATLYLRGCSQPVIQARMAEKRPYKLSIQTISRDLQELHNRWVKSSLLDIDTAKKQELERLRQLEEAYWTAWESSRKEATELATELTNDTQGGVATYSRALTKTKVVGRDGTARYLAGIERCIELRCKILGLFDAQKFALMDWRKSAADAGVPESVAVTEFEALIGKYQTALNQE